MSSLRAPRPPPQHMALCEHLLPYLTLTCSRRPTHPLQEVHPLHQVHRAWPNAVFSNLKPPMLSSDMVRPAVCGVCKRLRRNASSLLRITPAAGLFMISLCLACDSY